MDKQPQMVLAAAAAIVLALAGCGSSATKTVSVSSELPSGTTTQRTTTTSTSSSPPSTTRTMPGTSTNEGTSAGTTRTSTAPAFTKESSGGEGLGAAEAVVKAHGYTAGETSDYRPDQTLRVLVGTRTGSSDGYGQQAFFFVNGRYLGTDTSQPSATVKVVDQSDTEVMLAYPLYKPGDPLSHPSGGEKTIRFQLNNGRLVPLGQIPSAAARSGGE